MPLCRCWYLIHIISVLSQETGGSFVPGVLKWDEQPVPPWYLSEPFSIRRERDESGGWGGLEYIYINVYVYIYIYIYSYFFYIQWFLMRKSSVGSELGVAAPCTSLMQIVYGPLRVYYTVRGVQVKWRSAWKSEIILSPFLLWQTTPLKYIGADQIIQQSYRDNVCTQT